MRITCVSALRSEWMGNPEVRDSVAIHKGQKPGNLRKKSPGR